MRQFDICALKRRNGAVTHVVVLQHDEFSDADTVLVAPLPGPVSADPRLRLHPRLSFRGGDQCIVVERMAAIDRRHLGPIEGTAADHANAIKRAIDLTFFGY